MVRTWLATRAPGELASRGEKESRTGVFLCGYLLLRLHRRRERFGKGGQLDADFRHAAAVVTSLEARVLCREPLGDALNHWQLFEALLAEQQVGVVGFSSLLECRKRCLGGGQGRVDLVLVRLHRLEHLQKQSWQVQSGPCTHRAPGL